MVMILGRIKVMSCTVNSTISQLCNALTVLKLVPHNLCLTHKGKLLSGHTCISTIDVLIPLNTHLELKGGMDYKHDHDDSGTPQSITHGLPHTYNPLDLQNNMGDTTCKLGHSTPASSSCKANNRIPMDAQNPTPHRPDTDPYSDELMHNLESNLNLDTDWKPIPFQEDEDQNKQRFIDNWSRGITFSISSSPNNVIRLVSQMQNNRIIIRYITPFHVWPVTFIDNIPHWDEPQNTTDQQQHDMRKWWVQSIHMADQAETKFILYRLVTGTYTTTPTKLSTITYNTDEDGCSLQGTCFPCPRCKSPGNAHTHKWSISSLFGTLNPSCKFQRSAPVRLSVTEKNFLLQKPKPLIQNLTLRMNKLHKGSTPIDHSPPHDQLPHALKQPAEGPHRNDINILQWNMDKRGNQTLEEALILADKQRSDIICLQETENLDWVASTELIRKYGFNTILHGKVATLTNINTIDHRIINTWSQDDNIPVPPDTICVSVLTPLGETLIINSYVQNGVDQMPKNSNSMAMVELHHDMMFNLATEYHHTIICMDGNETSTPSDRIQIGHDNNITHSGNTSPNDKTIARYAKTFQNCHRLKNPQYYSARSLSNPSYDSYSNCQPTSEDRTVYSSIDYTLATNDISHYVKTCEYHDEVKLWGGGTKKFHKATVTNLKIPATPRKGDKEEPLKGRSLPRKPNLSNLTPEKESELSELVEQKLLTSWKSINHHTKGSTNPAAKRDMLMNILKNTINDSVDKIIGTLNYKKPHHQNRKRKSTNERALRLIERIGHVLHLSGKIWFSPDAPKDIEDEIIRADIIYLTKRGTVLPISTPEWIEWWPKRLSILKLNTIKTSAIKDADFLKNPKHTYRLCCKPNASSKISALKVGPDIITSDRGIEKELTNYIRTICGDEQKESHSDTPYSSTRKNPDYVHNVHLSNMLVTPTTEETLSMISDLSDSSPGHDAISPKIIKIISTKVWNTKVLKPKVTIQAEIRNKRYSQSLAAKAKASGLVDIPKEWLTPEETEMTIIGRPTRFVKLLTRLINLCLITKDIPNDEKHSIVTPIAKSGSQVRDTKNIRPIAVGPIIARIINKMMARRLADKLVRHNLLDPAQYAFLPGRSIHEPINSVLHCLDDYKSRQGTNLSTGCYIIYYDISKAYDCVRWSSIERALELLGMDPNFIDFVMNTLAGSTLAMKTNLSGRTTERVQMHGAIKQGCPLAPLLFAIVMDELHRGYRNIGGYQPMGTCPKVSSRGYCDDTTIISNSFKELTKMNDWTKKFMTDHGLNINVTKTKVTGRNRTGKANNKQVLWTGATTPLSTLAPTDSIKYLGCMISFDLDWTDQIKKMNGYVMNISTKLRHGNITLLQGSMLVKQVLDGMMDIGLRHAIIPEGKLKDWDDTLSRAILHRATLTGRSIHPSSVFTIIRKCSLASLNPIAKAAQIMDNITGPHELTKYYGDIVKRSNQRLQNHPDTDSDNDDEQDNRTTMIMKTLQAHDILIKENKDHAPAERITTYQPSDLKDFIKPLTNWSDHPQIPNTKNRPPNQVGSKIPYIDTYESWTVGHKTWAEDTTIHICTDGSTYPGKPSGAALAFIENNIKDYELWKTKGFYWKLTVIDNYIAEMSAINKALRVIPINVNVTIWTDSLSSIQAINKIRRGSSNYTRMSARPYLRSIKRIIDFRTAAGKITTINHIKSHTGFRDPASIGNSEADRLARHIGICNEPSEDCGINLLENELPFIIWTTTTTKNDQGKPITTNTPIHGDIRKALKKQQIQRQITEWSERPTRGELIRKHKSKALSLINNTWLYPTTITIQFLLDILNQADKKNFRIDSSEHMSIRIELSAILPQDKPCGLILNYLGPLTSTCANCSRQASSNTQHRLIDCPSMADIWNKADEDIWNILQLESTFHATHTPITKKLRTIQNTHMENSNYDRHMIWNLIIRCDSASSMSSPPLEQIVITATKAAETRSRGEDHVGIIPETHPCEGKCELGGCVCNLHANHKRKQSPTRSQQNASRTGGQPNKRTCLDKPPHDEQKIEHNHLQITTELRNKPARAVITGNQDKDHLAINQKACPCGGKRECPCKSYTDHKRKHSLLNTQQTATQPEESAAKIAVDLPSKRVCLENYLSSSDKYDCPLRLPNSNDTTPSKYYCYHCKCLGVLATSCPMHRLCSKCTRQSPLRCRHCPFDSAAEPIPRKHNQSWLAYQVGQRITTDLTVTRPPEDLNHRPDKRICQERPVSEPLKNHPLPPFPTTPPKNPTTEARVADYLSHIHTKDQPWWNCDSIYKVVAEHFHTENTLNTDALNYTGQTHWYSTDPHETTLGAQDGDINSYIQGHHTWINLETEPIDWGFEPSRAPFLLSGLTKLKPQTRIAYLSFNDIPAVLKAQATSYHTPVSFPPNSLTLHKPSNGPTKIITLLNQKTVYLHILDSTHTDKINYPDFLKAISNIIDKAIIKLPRANHPQLMSSNNHTPPRSHFRHPWKARPSLTWYRQPSPTKTPSSEDNHFNGEQRLEAILGLAPGKKLLRAHLSSCGHNPDTLHNEAMSEIDKVLLRAAHTAFKRWSLWDHNHRDG